jgi:hypothetical protein
MLVFLAITTEMGHDLWDRLTDYWATSDQLYMPFYNETGQISSHPMLSALHR